MVVGAHCLALPDEKCPGTAKLALSVIIMTVDA
jgi:hypothetical protein